MSARALLAELETAGVFLRREGEDVCVTKPPDFLLGPFVPAILAHKAALLVELRRRERKEPIEASTPPADWDGTIPPDCGVPHVCATLGPGPHCSPTACSPGLARAIPEEGTL